MVKEVGDVRGSGAGRGFRLRPRWDSNRLLPENDKGALYPIDATDDIQWNGKIDLSQWAGLVQKCQTRSLRQIAKEYGVSHEAVRRTLKQVAVRVL